MAFSDIGIGLAFLAGDRIISFTVRVLAGAGVHRLPGWALGRDGRQQSR